MTDILYVIVRNDIPSMNSGKAEAHSGHAASHFAFHYGSKHPNYFDTGRGFGIQINLNGSFEDIVSASRLLADSDIIYDRIYDPTYPYHCALTNTTQTYGSCTAFYFFGDNEDPIIKTISQTLGLKP